MRKSVENISFRRSFFKLLTNTFELSIRNFISMFDLSYSFFFLIAIPLFAIFIVLLIAS